MLQMFPELFTRIKVQPVQDLPREPAPLARGQCPPANCSADGTVAVLTPGIHNSAYYEHAFLADQMGVELVEGHDLRITDGKVAYAHDRRLQAHRRALSPGGRRFPRPDELQPPKASWACRGSWISTARAASPSQTRPEPASPTTRRSTATMPDIVEFYTGEKAILKNVPTWRCSEAEALSYVLDNLTELGGQGGARLGRLRHAGGPRRLEEGYRGLPQEASGAARQLHRAADAGTFDGADPDQGGPRAAPCGPAPLRVRCGPTGCTITPRRADAGGAQERLARGELLARGRTKDTLGGWRNKGMLGKGPQAGSSGMFRYSRTLPRTPRA